MKVSELIYSAGNILVSKSFRSLCILLLSVALPCSCIKEDMSLEEFVKVDDKLPDFEIVMYDGNIVTGADLRSTPSVVMFFHTSCPDCRQTLPRIQHLYEEYFARGVQFALISREEDSLSVAAYWETEGLTMPYSAQIDRKVYELFATRRVPRVYVSNDKGVVKHVFTDNPLPSDEDLKGAVEEVLSSTLP